MWPRNENGFECDPYKHGKRKEEKVTTKIEIYIHMFVHIFFKLAMNPGLTMLSYAIPIWILKMIMILSSFSIFYLVSDLTGWCDTHHTTTCLFVCLFIYVYFMCVTSCVSTDGHWILLTNFCPTSFKCNVFLKLVTLKSLLFFYSYLFLVYVFM